MGENVMGMASLAKGDFILLGRKRGPELAIVVEPPQEGWLRAFTAEGKIHRFPEALDIFGPVGHAPASASSEELRGLLNRQWALLEARSKDVDLELLRECTLTEPHRYSLAELADLLFEHGGTPEERGALHLALRSPRSPFASSPEGHLPLDGDGLAARESEREEAERAAERAAEEKAERARRKNERALRERETLVPELKLLLADRADPARLSPATTTWLSDLREALLTSRALADNGEITLGEGVIRIRDENHAVQLLTRAGLWDPDREDAIALRAEIGRPFPEAVVAEAAVVAPRDHPAEDLTDLPTCTIDNETTEDLDDAISIMTVAGGFRVSVHVADVERWITLGSALDRWGQETGESVYLPERVHHLFPSSLVQRVSLNPGVPRPAFSMSTVITSGGEVLEPEFRRTTIRSDERLDYAAADRRCENDPAWKGWSTVQTVLQARREQRGARVPLLPDLEIKPESGGVTARIVATDTPAHRLVAELMILFNEQIGLLFRRLGVPAIFKTQPPQTDDTTFPEDTDPLYFPRIVRLLRPSVAGLDPAPHSFLGVEAYCQATSPIRRFTDLIHQRQLAAVLAHETPPYSREQLGLVYPVLETRSMEVRQVERRRRRYWLLKHLNSLRGQRLKAIVSQMRNGRPVVFFPEYLLETPLLLPPDLALEVGDEMFVTPRKVDPIRGGVWASPTG